MRIFSITVLACWLNWGAALLADPVTERAGWIVIPTDMPFDALVTAVKTATKANGMGVVTEAGPTAMAASRGITIPGNRVIGVFNNEFAVRVLATSTAAMIEAPIRFYITETADGTGTLSYKTPSHVFAPYLDEGGEDLSDLAATLDQRFATIAQAAAMSSH